MVQVQDTIHSVKYSTQESENGISCEQLLNEPWESLGQVDQVPFRLNPFNQTLAWAGDTNQSAKAEHKKHATVRAFPNKKVKNMNRMKHTWKNESKGTHSFWRNSSPKHSLEKT